MMCMFRYPRILSPNQSLMSIIEEKDEDQTITSSQTLNSYENLESSDYSLNSINSIVTENMSSELKITELGDDEHCLELSKILNTSDLDKVNINSSKRIIENESMTRIENSESHFIKVSQADENVKKLLTADDENLFQTLSEYDQSGNLEKKLNASHEHLRQQSSTVQSIETSCVDNTSKSPVIFDHMEIILSLIHI